MWGGGGEESFRFNFGGDASHKSDDNDKEEECAHQDYRLRPTKKVDCSADIERGRAGTDAMFQVIAHPPRNSALFPLCVCVCVSVDVSLVVVVYVDSCIYTSMDIKRKRENLGTPSQSLSPSSVYSKCL